MQSAKVMELVEGGELFDHIVSIGSFTEPVARYAAKQQAVSRNALAATCCLCSTASLLRCLSRSQKV